MQNTLFSLGSGAFALDYDYSSTTHQISETTLSSVVLKTLEAGSPGQIPGACRFWWPSGTQVHIVSQHSGKCLEVAGASTANHAAVQQSQCRDGANQLWRLEASGEIVNLNSGKCLVVPNASEADHALLQQFECHAGTNQLWRTTPRGEIINVQSGKCLDLPSGQMADLVPAQQFHCHGTTNQQWTFP